MLGELSPRRRGELSHFENRSEYRKKENEIFEIKEIGSERRKKGKVVKISTDYP